MSENLPVNAKFPRLLFFLNLILKGEEKSNGRRNFP